MSEGELLALPMPQLGVSVEEGEVAAWHKQVGEAVAADEIVCEVTTDKVDVEVTAPAAGTLADIFVAVGEVVAVGEPLAALAPAGTGLPPAPVPPPGASSSSVAGGGLPTVDGVVDYAALATAAVPPRAAGQPAAASPVARRIARDRGIDLAQVEGSGINGRIRKADVLATEPPPADRAEPPADRAEPSAAALPADRPEPPPDGGLPAGYEDVPHLVVPSSAVRRSIAEHMSRSRHTAAHMTTEVEVDMHRVAALRAESNEARLAEGLAKLSFLPFVARAACAALADHPDLNASFDGERLIRWREVNLGIAVDTERGLMAPVIRGCEQLNVVAIGERIGDLAERARARRLTADDMRAGTFTLSNPGSVGAVSAHAIINQPQVAILGMPAIVRRPWVVAGPAGEEAIAIRPIMLLGLTFDHRAVDGAEATRCAVGIKRRLEDWGASAYA